MNLMFRTFIFLCTIAVTTTSCLKNNNNNCQYKPTNTTAPAGEQTAIKAYLDSNHIDAIKHPNGFYYTILTYGTKTDSIGVCSQIQINYSGKLVNGTVFDSNTNQWFTLGSLIDGWKYGIPLIGRGGHIKLYIPPSLGYGSIDIKQGTTVVIPANSILIFDITMMDYTKQN
jgi:FKBP-type peptidyl-prolyl cis-trans isomerase FkpA